MSSSNNCQVKLVFFDLLTLTFALWALSIFFLLWNLEACLFPFLHLGQVWRIIYANFADWKIFLAPPFPLLSINAFTIYKFITKRTVEADVLCPPTPPRPPLVACSQQHSIDLQPGCYSHKTSQQNKSGNFSSLTTRGVGASIFPFK